MHTMYTFRAYIPEGTAALSKAAYAGVQYVMDYNPAQLFLSYTAAGNGAEGCSAQIFLTPIPITHFP